MISAATVAILVFILVYIAITFELVNKAVAALLGVLILIMLGIVSEHGAIELIDFETILLLTGMMAIVAMLRKSGFFSLVSVRIAELTGGSPLKILLLFSVVTAVLSAFLDNVTTVIIIIPIIIELTEGMGLDSKIYIISQALISNIGGTATLIGDPPNIIIGSKVGLTFNQFLVNLTIPVAITFVASLFYIWITNRDKFKPINKNLVKTFSVKLLLEKIRFEFLNTKIDKPFMIKCLICLGFTVILFITQTITELSPGVAAMFGAMVLFTISQTDVEHILEDVEWSTILFFAGLFILVGVLEKRGVIEWVARNIFLQIGNNPYLMVLMILWVSGIFSGFLDNVPFTITMVPVIHLIMQSNPIPNNILWWALSLGACFGGNLTMIGSSANIVSVALSKKHKHNLSFLRFMKTGLPVTIISLIISSAYLSIYLWWSL